MESLPPHLLLSNAPACPFYFTAGVVGLTAPLENTGGDNTGQTLKNRHRQCRKTAGERVIGLGLG